jgi:hypothetical protein
MAAKSFMIQAPGQNIGQDFNSRSGRMLVTHFMFYLAKLPILELETKAKLISR